MSEDGDFFEAPLSDPTSGGAPAGVWQQLVLAGLVQKGGGLIDEARVAAGLPTNLRTRADVALKAEVTKRASDSNDGEAFLAAYETLPPELIPKLWRVAAERLEIRYGLLRNVSRAAVALALFNLR